MSILSIDRPSVDTVRVFIPCSTSFDELPFSQRGLSYFWPADQAQGLEPKYSFFPLLDHEIDRRASNHALPGLKPHGDGLIFQFSLPKMLRGHSLWHPTIQDLEKCLMAIHSALARIWSDCPDLSSWRFLRLDLSVNFRCDDITQVQEIRKKLARLKYLGKSSLSSGKRGVVYSYWASPGKTIKFYTKGLEFHQTDRLKSDKILFASKSPGTAGFHSLPLLRFEVEYKQRGLCTLFDCTASELSLQRVMRWYQEIQLRPWLDSYFRHLNRVESVYALTVIHDRVRESSARPAALLRFVDDIIDNGSQVVKSRTSNGAFYRRSASLARLGISIEDLDNFLQLRSVDSFQGLPSLYDLPIDSGFDGVEERDDFSIFIGSLLDSDLRVLRKKIRANQVEAV